MPETTPAEMSQDPDQQEPGYSVQDKVRFLSNAQSYDHEPEEVRVVETHMSWVFLAGNLVFKLKKPVKRDMLNFSTLRHRDRAVHDETRLNRRLAPDVYLDPRPLRSAPDGRLSLGGTGAVVDWLVVMRRLREDRNLETLISDGRLRPRHVDAIAARLAAFYRDLPREDVGPGDYFDRFAAEHCRNRAVLEDPSLALDDTHLKDALAACESRLETVRPVLTRRVEQGRIVEGHGDLRPQHVFLDDPPVVIDCLEFNRDLRTVDPFDEIAFLGMEAAQLGADRVFQRLAGRLRDALDDRPPAVLLDFFWRYRALLRARLTLLHLADDTPRSPGKWRPLARRYVTLSLNAEIMTRLPEDP